MLRRPPPMLLAALLTAVLLPAAPAAAQEEPLEMADDPFEVTDPRAAPPGEAEVAVVGAYARARGGRVRGTVGLETEMEIGVAPGLELRIGQVGAYGNLEVRRRVDAAGPAPGPGQGRGGADEGGRERWGGATRLGFLYHLADERGLLPAVGLLGRVRMVYGPGRPAYETEAIALMGKTLLGGERPLAAHLNLGWLARLDPLPGERPNRYLFNVSVGQTLTRDTVLVGTYVREQQERGERDFGLLQAGLRQRLPGGRAVLGLAAGVGLGRDSPRFQVGVALQWELGGG